MQAVAHTAMAALVKGTVDPVHARSRIQGEEVQLHSFLTSALDGGQWLTSRPDRFTTGERTPVPIQQKAGWAPQQV